MRDTFYMELAAGLELGNRTGINTGRSEQDVYKRQALDIIRGLGPDVIVVVAYGRILPKDILTLPPYGCINIHGSLLPKYRGSAPIQWAVLNGEKTTGVCSMHLVEQMDAGDVIFSEETAIAPDETSEMLFERLAPMGAELLVRTLQALETGTAPRTPQDLSLIHILVKSIAERLKKRVWEWSIKLLVMNGALSVMLFVFQNMIFSGSFFENGKLLIYLVFNLCFIVYDVGVSRLIVFYCRRISKYGHMG